MNHWLEVGRRYADDNYNVDLGYEILKCRRAAVALGVCWERVVSSSRMQEICDFRFMAMKHLRDRGFSYREVGEVLGHRDHTTVLYGVKQAHALLDTDRTFRRKFTIFRQS
jgi:chromosomal replication initiation ATPase DnaA